MVSITVNVPGSVDIPTVNPLSLVIPVTRHVPLNPELPKPVLLLTLFTLIVSNNGNVKKPVISYKGIPEKNEYDTFIFDMEEEIMNICRTFSMDNKKQQQNLIETLKQNCRKIVKEKTGKKPFTNINIARI